MLRPQHEHEHSYYHLRLAPALLTRLGHWPRPSQGRCEKIYICHRMYTYPTCRIDSRCSISYAWISVPLPPLSTVVSPLCLANAPPPLFSARRSLSNVPPPPGQTHRARGMLAKGASRIPFPPQPAECMSSTRRTGDTRGDARGCTAVAADGRI